MVWGVRERRRRVGAGARSAPADDLPGLESQLREGTTREHMKEYPLVRIIRATNLACLDAPDVPRVARHPFTDLPCGPPYRRRELPLGLGAPQCAEDEIGAAGAGGGR